MAVELEPEPVGGEEIEAIQSMANSRVKNMGPVDDDSIKGEDGSTVYNFWLNASVEASLVKEIRVTVEKDASRNANFPGFRKGQIPPWAQPQLTGFAVQEGIIRTCEAAVKAYGLAALKGSDGEVEVKEDVKEISKGYKMGSNIPFTATFRATIEQTEEEEEESSDDTKEEETPSEE
eukprot:CAMPEP_0178964982 /NCGR_PEP_ID=MMETSP0789-20121207/16000_1 /TAXON_ID=3005 /ORGANISM="Rhizosolenia setigera, Strain CCMP 1694" /LENGTH=176 /DNA_ID=CAMNT_0020649859 /DNA_START=168 /DNA_END=698 /DNA_ORIENTATION=+